MFTIFLILAVFTSFMAGLRALFELDFKKIIALSTLRQLGIIIRILGIGNFLLSYYHLLTHALFKSLLFLCAGVLIHSFMGAQDLRNIGRCFVRNPYLCFIIGVANFRLRGFPFMRGFYSKDLIIEFFMFSSSNVVILILLGFSVLFTPIYSFRIIYYSIFSKIKVKVRRIESKLVIFVTFVLIVIRILGGSLLS
jgi:NADH-ubiquinone oxidoreductase chain 5